MFAILEKQKIKVWSSFAVLLLAGLATFLMPMNAHAIENQKLTGALYRSSQGSTYWTTSNLREWLNSDQAIVSYSNQAPTKDKLGNNAYDSEPGFLSNFTKEELDDIAVTEHRVLLSTPDSVVKDGGSGQVVSNIYYGASMTFALVNILNNYQNYAYKLENDKVFLLNDWEVYQYIQKRGWNLEKSITPEAKAKNSYYSNSIAWWINGPSENIGNEQNHTIVSDTDSVRNASPNTARGIVPAIQLKPSAIIDGKKVSDLKIGDIVAFGHYLNSPIQWRVININDKGYPLLITEQVIDIKPYDAPGDSFSYENSNTINFPTADSSIADYDYHSTNGSEDTTPPVVKVLNDDEMEMRQNGEFTLDIEVTDDGSGLDYVILPDGTLIHSNRFSYTIGNNTNYLIRAMDKAGNMKIFTIPIGNINPPSSVRIESSANGWTNQDVTVNIFASNDVGFTQPEAIQGGRDYTYYSFPNFTSYTGKRFRISGSVELIKADKPVDNLKANIGFYYHTRQKNGEDYMANYAWITAWSVPLKELQEKGEVPFDFEYTIGGNYYQNIQAWSQIPIPSGEKSYTLRWKNVKYELVDNDDFKIDKIVLPNGKEVLDNQYTDVLTKEGSYTYKVIDNRGKDTEKTITVLIDKVKPSIAIDYNKAIGQKDIMLNLSVSDDRSGVKEVVLPNGSKTSQENLTYTVKANGTYSFSATDQAGNVTTKTVTISNIDDTKPSIQLSQDPEGEFTNGVVTITAITSDGESGVKSIQLPDGTIVNGDKATYTVDENGDYPFAVADNAGNITTDIYSVSNIDKGLPNLKITEIGQDQNGAIVRFEYSD